MTPEQIRWLDQNPTFQPVGPPRSGVSFCEFGTLYADGSYDKSEPLKPIRMRAGCIGVGIQKEQEHD